MVGLPKRYDGGGGSGGGGGGGDLTTRTTTSTLLQKFNSTYPHPGSRTWVTPRAAMPFFCCAIVRNV